MNIFDAHPELAETIGTKWKSRGMVPIAVRSHPMPGCEGHAGYIAIMGTFAEYAATVTLPDPFTAEDFIVGMELLGFRFGIGELNGREALYTELPDTLPDSWDRHSLRLMTLFDRKTRTAEALAFLCEREAGKR